MERKVGEIFELDGRKYRVDKDVANCESCAFDHLGCEKFRSVLGSCAAIDRDQNDDIVFIEMDDTPKEESDVRDDIFSSPEKSILQKAQEIIDGSRNSDYGDPVVNFNRISKLVYYITGKQVDPATCCAVQMAVKLSREMYRHKEDNLVDLCGYAEIYNRIKASENKE